MSCIIIAKDHEVINYTVNGRKHSIVDRIASKKNGDAAVADVKRSICRTNDWSKLTNVIDDIYNGEVPKAISNAVDRLTF